MNYCQRTGLRAKVDDKYITIVAQEGYVIELLCWSSFREAWNIFVQAESYSRGLDIHKAHKSTKHYESTNVHTRYHSPKN